ncbi:hypothetical protein BJ875DRAFT_247722 [Amylocarpus encephaloides]|uniref:Uncharacterized protein n=1 Tax=Amylocarpus encephaloides TaxID=45428 RepID=A0A9P7Y7V7_9HELO|nr:hypothetical protein BJ875DRAFT_247722 [Amylocarpus encephaloides]
MWEYMSFCGSGRRKLSYLLAILTGRSIGAPLPSVRGMQEEIGKHFLLQFLKFLLSLLESGRGHQSSFIFCNLRCKGLMLLLSISRHPFQFLLLKSLSIQKHSDLIIRGCSHFYVGVLSCILNFFLGSWSAWLKRFWYMLLVIIPLRRNRGTLHFHQFRIIMKRTIKLPALEKLGVPYLVWALGLAFNQQRGMIKTFLFPRHT